MLLQSKTISRLCTVHQVLFASSSICSYYISLTSHASGKKSNVFCDGKQSDHSHRQTDRKKCSIYLLRYDTNNMAKQGKRKQSFAIPLNTISFLIVAIVPSIVSFLIFASYYSWYGLSFLLLLLFLVWFLFSPSCCSLVLCPLNTISCWLRKVREMLLILVW
jgi:hypothetical protein